LVFTQRGGSDCSEFTPGKSRLEPFFKFALVFGTCDQGSETRLALLRRNDNELFTQEH
jgi:hypothetical protein